MYLPQTFLHARTYVAIIELLRVLKGVHNESIDMFNESDGKLFEERVEE